MAVLSAATWSKSPQYYKKLTEIEISNCSFYLKLKIALLYKGEINDLLFCWLVELDVIKWACNLSATALPSVINWCDKSLEKNAFALPVQ